MSQFLTLDAPVMVFTDHTFTAGGVTDGSVPAAILTRGTTLLLRDLFFPEAGTEQAEAPPLSVDALESQLQERVPGRSQEAASGLVAMFLEQIPHLATREGPTTLGPVEIQEFSEDGLVELAPGTRAFRPAGRLYRRAVNDRTMWFAVAEESLAGVVEPNSSITSLTTDYSGVTISDLSVVRSGSGCGSCGACGACGLCTFCGELNLGSGVSAAIAVTAFAALGEAKTERPVFEVDLRARPTPTPILTEVDRRLRELGTVARTLDDDWGR
ncbi:hypothetical protein [Prauserella flavalba]|uniref:Uncharacterized protein n=1 Tax=Prauserella flavalba TaxID=1477506 RepID=A0A318LNN8_9PSEU|nr:hypothetical protein [Prauserella flavalba]PXY36202.1 hypothetical protein BA062_12255 [Prauserella flavalba]